MDEVEGLTFNFFIMNSDKRLSKKIKTFLNMHYPNGMFTKKEGVYLCYKTNTLLDKEVMYWLEQHGYIRMHMGTCLNSLFYTIDSAPHGLVLKQGLL